MSESRHDQRLSIPEYPPVTIMMPGMWTTAITAWCNSLTAAGRPASTIRLRRYQLRRFAHEHPGSPWDVTEDQVISWVASRGPSLNTLRSWRGALRGFYGWAHTTGRTDSNPALAIPAIGTPQPDPRPTPDAALMAALTSAAPRVVLMIRLGHQLGMRRAEVARVHTSDVVDTRSGWSLRVHGKGGKIRRVPLPDDLAGVLLRAPAGYLFPGQFHGHLSPDWVGRLVSRTLPRGWAMHSLRHRFASDAWAEGGDLAIVQTLLGHASPVTTRGYVLVPDDALRTVVNAVARHQIRPSLRSAAA